VVSSEDPLAGNIDIGFQQHNRGVSMEVRSQSDHPFDYMELSVSNYAQLVLQTRENTKRLPGAPFLHRPLVCLKYFHFTLQALKRVGDLQRKRVSAHIFEEIYSEWFTLLVM
jgi:hypothetical protein